MEEKVVRSSKKKIMIMEGQERRVVGREEDTDREDVRERTKMNVRADYSLPLGTSNEEKKNQGAGRNV